MVSHTGRSFLNSCLKVPIDPCNNCPAPIYNRPKMYLGRLSMTPTTALPTTSLVTTKTCDTEMDTKWSCSGIRSLAKFYDSIPDYQELNHLTEEEFYSTLDTLRSTCRDLKVKTSNSCAVTEDRCSNTSYSLSSANCFTIRGSQHKKTKKSKNKKKSCSKPSRSVKVTESQELESILDFTTANSTKMLESKHAAAESKPFEGLASKSCSFKKDLEQEVECFKKSLKDFEEEFKRPATSSVLYRDTSSPFVRRLSTMPKDTTRDVHETEKDKVPARPTYTSALRERLRKSLSFNDLHTIPDAEELLELHKKTKTLERLAFRGDGNTYQDPNKLSNYFHVRQKSNAEGNIPKIVVDTPSTDSSTKRSGSAGRKHKGKAKQEYKIPFKIFDLDSDKREEDSTKHSTPSPVHPVARPNLAATLREECSRKKVKELKNNCTYNDTTPQFDWEVRKTPAWKTLSLNFKKDLEQEVECFKKSLKDFEEEFKRPATSSVLYRDTSSPFVRRLSTMPKDTTRDVHETEKDKVPARPTYTSALRERLRKSLSFNDLHTIPDAEELLELHKKTKTLERLAFRGDGNTYQDPNKLSNYFHVRQKSNAEGNIPKIVVDTPSTDSSTKRSGSAGRKHKGKAKQEYKIPFKIFDLDSDKREEDSTKHSTPSPVHPVARPNLAATLREECSRKKVKELKNNCTYNDTTPQFDWEVRKTPAWKTLSLNETHKEILSLRLATRKAEQALQKREYELNMELMRQRVKSAPLLLEGPTYWGPHVGKLTHECQREGRRHMCQSNQHRLKRKKNNSRGHNCRRGLFQNSSPELFFANHQEASAPSNTMNHETSRTCQKLNTLRKIYGGSLTTKSQSRCSNHSSNTQRSTRSFAVKKEAQDKERKPEANLLVDNDSADELSSLDRAFL